MHGRFPRAYRAPMGGVVVLPALATTEDLARFGYPVTASTMLDRASVRVRRYAGQDITAGTSTVTIYGPIHRLPQRPIVLVTSVKTLDGADVDYEVGSAGHLHICSEGTVEVTYDHGYDLVPDEIVELVCGIAARMTDTPASVAGGAQTEQAGGESVTWGGDAFGGTTSLTREEKRVIDRLFPPLPKTIHLL